MKFVTSIVKLTKGYIYIYIYILNSIISLIIGNFKYVHIPKTRQ